MAWTIYAYVIEKRWRIGWRRRRELITDGWSIREKSITYHRCTCWRWNERERDDEKDPSFPLFASPCPRIFVFLFSKASLTMINISRKGTADRFVIASNRFSLRRFRRDKLIKIDIYSMSSTVCLSVCLFLPLSSSDHGESFFSPP